MRRRDLAIAIWALAVAWGCRALAAPEVVGAAADNDLPPAATAPPLPALEEVAQRLATIEAELARLTPQAVLQPRLADYDRRLAVIKTRFRPDCAQAETNQLELHVVGVHEGFLIGPGRRVADVRVTYTAAPIILCLCSYNPVEWRLQVGDNVRLAQVILSGYERQTLVGAPAGVPVANYSRPEAGEYLGRAFARDQVESDAGYAPFAAALLEKTGLPINTFQGAYSAPKDVLIVGPESDAWRSERVRTEVATLAAEVADERRRVLWPDLKDLRFSARLPSAGLHGGRAKSYGQFSLAGPLLNTHQQIPEKARNVSQMVVDPQGPVHYAFNGEGLVALDLTAGKGRYIELDEDQGELHSVCGLTFDSRRRRVVLATNSRPGHLYRYEPDASRWLPLKSLENVGLLSLAYLEAQDALYGLAFDGETLQLYRFDAEGKVESKLPTKGLPLKARGPFAEGVAQLQLVAADDRLVALVEYEALRRESGATLQAYLLDPVSAEVIFSSDVLPAPATLAPEQVAVGKLAPVPPDLPRESREEFELSLPPPAAHRFEKNDHYYELLDLRRAVTWAEARDIAAGRSYEGRPGYLATITSAEESQFINEHWKTARRAAWLGASDHEQEGEWKWVTGPEAGTVFWRGGSDGQAIGFHNWGRTQLLEPNNRMRDGLGENFGLWNWSFGQTGPFYWNDARADVTQNSLLIEYSSPPRGDASPEKEAVVPPAEEQSKSTPPAP